MSSSATWEHLLAAPAPRQHVAQLCADEGFLARAVGRFVGDGLRRGEAAIVIPTAAHWQTIAREFERDGFVVDEVTRRGQLVVLDAAECLGKILVDGMPDRARFRTVIEGAIDAANAAGYRAVRAFGEMVDLLRRSGLAATLGVEALWTEVLDSRGIALLCGYSLDTFDPYIYRGLLQHVSRAHSDLIPVEDYARLEHAVERAYTDVFGAGGDSTNLRNAFLAHYERPAAMPDAQAAILAVRELLPKTVDALLERVRHHYAEAPAALTR